MCREYDEIEDEEFSDMFSQDGDLTEEDKLL
jgi:hypothetical protein